MPAFELRAPEPGKGFALLPEPQAGDQFYDIEGDPHFEGGLEYLHGVWFDGQFQPFWAHDHAAEARALAELLEFFRARLTAYPEARIYHYAPYEITALRRLTTKYGIGEAFLDRLLRERRFVDLFAVVRGGADRLRAQLFHQVDGGLLWPKARWRGEDGGRLCRGL
ncbi:predicted RecB family nuclease [Rhodobacter sp. JA431]|nr:predicted RecB family nuclease [Rhodobacter sp. JA431]